MRLDEGCFLLAVEGGGTRCQVAVLDWQGRLRQTRETTSVNPLFTSPAESQAAMRAAAHEALDASGVAGGQVSAIPYALVGFKSSLFEEALRGVCPAAVFKRYGEDQVVFARTGHHRPHGVAVVASTGCSAWAVRQDDGRYFFTGGWGPLLGDEGSAYAVGLLGLRAAVRAFDSRLDVPTGLVEAARQYWSLEQFAFAPLIELAYNKPMSRAEIAGFAPQVTRLAAEGDLAAARIVSKVANDMASLTLHAARSLFTPDETLIVVAAGGLTNAGEMVVGPLRQRLREEFPQASLEVGTEMPAVALGRLALNEPKTERCHVNRKIL